MKRNSNAVKRTSNNMKTKQPPRSISVDKKKFVQDQNKPRAKSKQPSRRKSISMFKVRDIYKPFSFKNSLRSYKPKNNKKKNLKRKSCSNFLRRRKIIRPKLVKTPSASGKQKQLESEQKKNAAIIEIAETFKRKMIEITLESNKIQEEEKDNQNSIQKSHPASPQNLQRIKHNEEIQLSIELSLKKPKLVEQNKIEDFSIPKEQPNQKGTKMEMDLLNQENQENVDSNLPKQQLGKVSTPTKLLKENKSEVNIMKVLTGNIKKGLSVRFENGRETKQEHKISLKHEEFAQSRRDKIKSRKLTPFHKKNMEVEEGKYIVVKQDKVCKELMQDFNQK